MYYEDVFRALEEHRVEYAVAGGVALVLHGVVRLTADLDLVVHLTKDNLGRFIAAMTVAGYRPAVPVPASDLMDRAKRRAWREEKNMTVFCFHHPDHPMRRVDVFIDEPIRFRDLAGDLVVFPAKGIRIPVVSKEHLIEMKRMAGRSQDMADVEALERLADGKRHG